MKARHRRIAAVLASIAVMSPTLLGAGAFADPGTGTLVVDPPSGNLDSILTVSTVGPCERGVTVVVYGAGRDIDPETADNLVGNTSLGKLEPTYTQSHAVPLMTTLGNYFRAAVGKARPGTYDLVLACRNTTDFTDLQTFTASIEVAKDGTYRALGSSGQSIEDALAASGLEVVEGLPEQVRALAADPVLGNLGGDGSAPVDEPSLAAQSEEADPQPPARTILIAAGLLLVLGAGFAWWRLGRSTS